MLEAYDRIVGLMLELMLEQMSVDECITKAPGGDEVAGRSPANRGKQGLKRSSLVEGYTATAAAARTSACTIATAGGREGPTAG